MISYAKTFFLSAMAILLAVAAGFASAVDYEFSVIKQDPFVPQYLSSKLEAVPSITDRTPIHERYSLVGIWKSGDSKWRAMLSKKNAMNHSDEDAVEAEPLMLEVGARVEAGVKLAAIELGAVVLSESLRLPDGRIFTKLTRLEFESDD